MPLLLALCVAALVIVALGFWLRRRGSWLRLLGFALVLLALGDPSLVSEERNPLKDVVAVVLDRSASQSIGERKAQTDAARAEIEKAMEQLGSIELRIVDGGAVDTGQDGTRLFNALCGILRGGIGRVRITKSVSF